MAFVDVVMPKMGESIMEATILRWHKKPGDAVKMDEALMDIATDKVDSEVPSTAEGILEERLFAENDVVPVGAVVARIRATVGANAEELAPSVPDKDLQQTPASLQDEEPPSVVHADRAPSQVPYQPTQSNTLKPSGARFYSPLVLNIASSEGISMIELESIPGTGAEGRVTKRDILDYVEGRKYTSTRDIKEDVVESRTGASPDTGHQKSSTPISPLNFSTGNVEVMEMDRMRRLIAEHMVHSKATSAHVTSFAEADVTRMVMWREKVKNDFEKREGGKITYTPLMIEATIKCLRQHPLLNSSVDKDRILLKKDINIGMATALPSGNLIVPVIRDADQLNLVGLTRQVNQLADRARNNRLKPDETQGGTFTITNVGSFGSIMGTPIINQPQVAILATGAIRKKPVVIESPEGDSIGIRHIMYLSLSYDHRIIDGALGAKFLASMVRELEHFDLNRSL